MAIENELWTWRVFYSDGTTLDENDSQHGFADIEQERLAACVLIPLVEGLPSHIVKIDGAAGQRLVFFRQRRAIVGWESGCIEGFGTRCHILGWQKTIKIGSQERNVKAVAFLFADGSILFADDLDAVDQEFLPNTPELVTLETVYAPVVDGPKVLFDAPQE